MIKYRSEHDISFVREKNNDVKYYMNKGVAFIVQTPLINGNNMTFGIEEYSNKV